MDDYNRKINSINPSEYNFVICGKDLKTSRQDMLPILEQCLKMYKDSKFKRYYSSKPTSPTCFLQLKKLLDKVGIDMNFDETVEDIIEKL